MDQVEEHLHKADWLDSTTRTAAISKLQNTSYIIGGPEEMYYAEQFDKDFGAGNVIRVVEKKGLDSLMGCDLGNICAKAER
jgi:predicted metalloendopeptidase